MGFITAHFGVQLGPGKAEVRLGELPPLLPDQMLLKMEICNICTEDYQRWMGLRQFPSPMADGHEYVGIVIEKGAEVIGEFQLGNRVGKLNQQCGVCGDCRTGNTGDCRYAPYTGVGLDGFHGVKGFANYKFIPQRLAIKVSNDIPAQEAAFLEPVATVIQGMKRARVKPADTVVVVGAGAMGLINAQVAKAYGARVIMTDISDKKIRRATDMEIGPVVNAKTCDPVAVVRELTGGGADVVIPAVGNTAAYRQAYDMLRHFKGRMLIFAAGYPKPELDFDANLLHYRKQEIIGTVNADNADFIEAAKMLGDRSIDVSKCLEGKTFPLREFARALEHASMPDSYRVSVDLQSI